MKFEDQINVLSKAELERSEAIRQFMNHNQMIFGETLVNYDFIDSVTSDMVEMLDYYNSKLGILEFNVYFSHALNLLNFHFLMDLGRPMFREGRVPEKYILTMCALPARGKNHVEVVPKINWG